VILKNWNTAAIISFYVVMESGTNNSLFVNKVLFAVIELVLDT